MNGSITAWARRTGTRGDGEPVLSAVTLAHALPCASIAPSDRRVMEAQSQGIELTRVVQVWSRSLEAQAITPAVGDRLTVRTPRPWITDVEMDIVAIRPLGSQSEVVELAMGSRRDTQ